VGLGASACPRGSKRSSAYSGRHGREALDDYVEKMLEKSSNVRIVSLCLVIPLLCLVIPLTNPRKLCKIRGIQGTKEKTASGPSALATSTKELPTANSHRKSLAASGALVKYSLHGHWRIFYGCG
jgi:hypothetical protein